MKKSGFLWGVLSFTTLACVGAGLVSCSSGSAENSTATSPPTDTSGGNDKVPASVRNKLAEVGTWEFDSFVMTGNTTIQDSRTNNDGSYQQERVLKDILEISFVHDPVKADADFSDKARSSYEESVAKTVHFKTAVLMPNLILVQNDQAYFCLAPAIRTSSSEEFEDKLQLGTSAKLRNSMEYREFVINLKSGECAGDCEGFDGGSIKYDQWPDRKELVEKTDFVVQERRIISEQPILKPLFNYLSIANIVGSDIHFGFKIDNVLLFGEQGYGACKIFGGLADQFACGYPLSEEYIIPTFSGQLLSPRTDSGSVSYSRTISTNLDVKLRPRDNTTATPIPDGACSKNFNISHPIEDTEK